MTPSFTLRHGEPPPVDALLALYDAVGWTAYTRDPDGLVRAVQTAHHLATVWHEATLVGLARWLSDDTAIAWLQDVLVHPDWRRHGLGRTLVQDGLDRYAHVRSVALMTDDRPEQHAFYRSLGFLPLTERPPLHGFVRIR